MARLRREHPGGGVELWAGDESRPGLKPIARRAWAVKGRRPTASGRTGDQRLYFVHPAGGRDLELIPPAADTGRRARAPEEFARRADRDRPELLVVRVDSAGWHIAGRLAVPPGAVPHRLPPGAPGSRPAEPLWPLVRQAVADAGYDELGAMEPVLVGRCRWRRRLSGTYVSCRPIRSARLMPIFGGPPSRKAWELGEFNVSRHPCFDRMSRNSGLDR
jgi:hypothetical protein